MAWSDQSFGFAFLLGECLLLVLEKLLDEPHIGHHIRSLGLQHLQPFLVAQFLELHEIGYHDGGRPRNSNETVNQDAMIFEISK